MTVHLYDDAGNHISALTDDAGIAVLDPSSDLVGGRYRVQVDNPRPDFFYPAHAANGQSAQAAKITAADLQSATTPSCPRRSSSSMSARIGTRT